MDNQQSWYASTPYVPGSSVGRHAYEAVVLIKLVPIGMESVLQSLGGCSIGGMNNY